MASYIRRRTFLATLLGGAAVTWPIAASTQQPAMRVIGYFKQQSGCPLPLRTYLGML
jgi:hypothetical protein